MQVQVRNQFIHTLSETTLIPTVTALKLSFSVISDQTSDTHMDVYVFVTTVCLDQRSLTLIGSSSCSLTAQKGGGEDEGGPQSPDPGSPIKLLSFD